MKLRFFLVLALLCSLFGAKELKAQGCSVTNSFSSYTAQYLNAPLETNMDYSVLWFWNQTTVEGSTSMNVATCRQATYAQHHINIVNTITQNGVNRTTSNSSSPQCANCYLSLSNEAELSSTFDSPTDIEVSEDDYSLVCSIVGNFGGGGGGSGSVVGKFLRVLTGASAPDTTVSPGNCSPGTFTGQEICDIPVKDWCSIPNPAVNASLMRAQTSPAEAKWWRTWDACYRWTPNNSTPWICPTWHITVPYGSLGVTIGVPFGLDLFTTKPLNGYSGCDANNKP
jgi:hypothetical protein